MRTHNIYEIVTHQSSGGENVIFVSGDNVADALDNALSVAPSLTEFTEVKIRLVGEAHIITKDK